MSVRSVFATLFVAAAVAAAGTAEAATRYVSDELSINLRRGPGNEYRITEMLKSGRQVEVLEENGEGWSRVRTTQGEEGWVLTRFLSNTPAARERLAAMQERVARLEENNAELKQELAQALDGTEELGNLKKELVAENESLRSELEEIRDASANAIRIKKENQQFREQLLELQSELEQLRHENEALQSRREGMKIGALVLAGGIVIGLVLPLFRGRRRSNWDSL